MASLCDCSCNPCAVLHFGTKCVAQLSFQGLEAFWGDWGGLEHPHGPWKAPQEGGDPAGRVFPKRGTGGAQGWLRWHLAVPKARLGMPWVTPALAGADPCRSHGVTHCSSPRHFWELLGHFHGSGQQWPQILSATSATFIVLKEK